MAYLKKQAAALRMIDIDRLVIYLRDQHDSADKIPKVIQAQKQRLIAIRDTALLLLAFFGALRRSELLNLHWEDIDFVRDGMILQIRRSKTDQEGEGARCMIPFGNIERCPVRALIEWRKASRQNLGAIFAGINTQGVVTGKSLHPSYWNRRLKQLAKSSGVPNAENISSHSCRRGFASESARLGASIPAIQRHGRWRTTDMVYEYIEIGQSFKDSAVKVLYEY